MTALDVFRRCGNAEKEIAALEEKIERRRAMAEGNGSVQPNADGGSRGSRDASMRLLDYVANIAELEAKLERRRQAELEDKACCVYLAEQLEDRFGRAMLAVYVEHKGTKAAATEMGYSLSQFKRIRQGAEDICRRMDILIWDRKHVPLVSLREK